MLPAETFEVGKRLLTFSLAKRRWNTEECLKTYVNSLFMKLYITLLIYFVTKRRSILIKVTLRRVHVIIVAVKRSITYSECAYVALVILHTKRMHRIVLSYGMSDSTIGSASYKRHAVRINVI